MGIVALLFAGLFAAAALGLATWVWVDVSDLPRPDDSQVAFGKR